LMLLEQQQKKRLWMLRQDQEIISCRVEEQE